MKKYLLLLLSFLVMLSVSLACAQDKDDDDEEKIPKPHLLKPDEQPPGMKYDCPYQKGFERPQKIGSYTLRLLPGNNKANDRCQATLVSGSGQAITVASDWALTVDKISGTDINGDGKPELVLDGHSGGANCCYTYTIVSLGATPQVLRNFSNQLPVVFEKQADGTTLIRTGDSVFDFFMVPHFESVIPQLVLKMEDNKFVDVSEQFSREYDKRIEQARNQLKPADLDKFRQSRFGDKLFTDQLPTLRGVLVIVLNYLYSGRPDKAWQAVGELWPLSDQELIKSLILERRGRGLLKQIADETMGADQKSESRNH